MRKLAPARVSYRDDFLISYRVYIMTESFHILLFEGARVIQNRKHYACATRSSLPADRFHTETGGRFAFTWYRCEISYRSEISPRYKNRSELTPGWLEPAWHFVVVSCKQIQSHEREPQWTRSGTKVAPVSCKQPLIHFQRLQRRSLKVPVDWCTCVLDTIC